MKKIIAIFIITILSGCYNAPNMLKPMPWIFDQMPKDAPNIYKRAWKDGCETGLGSMTNSMYRTFYSFKQDPQLRKDSTYYAVWKDTYNFCRHYAYGTLRQSNQRLNLPNNLNQSQQTFMGASGIFEEGPLQLFGPGGNTLLPFQKIGPVAGNRWLPLDMGGQSEIDFTGGDFTPSIGMGGWNMNFGNDTPFFGDSDY